MAKTLLLKHYREGAAAPVIAVRWTSGGPTRSRHTSGS